MPFILGLFCSHLFEVYPKHIMVQSTSFSVTLKREQIESEAWDGKSSGKYGNMIDGTAS